MTERSDHAVAVAVGALGGIVLVLLGCSPTGSATTDVPVLVATAAAAVWAMSSLRWSIVVAATGVAALWATPGATTIALIAAAVVVIGTTSVVAITDGEHLRPALLAAVTLALLGEGRTAGPHGVGAVAIVLAVAALSALGLRLRPQPVRRRVLVAFGATAFAGFTATAATTSEPVIAPPGTASLHSRGPTSTSPVDTSELQPPRSTVQRVGSAPRGPDRPDWYRSSGSITEQRRR
ncbi:MAG: hypothetical protein ACO3D0_11120 [Ilumatobacteraceae bacterium]